MSKTELTLQTTMNILSTNNYCVAIQIQASSCIISLGAMELLAAQKLLETHN